MLYDDYSDNPRLQQLSDLIESRAERDRKKGKQSTVRLAFIDLSPQETYNELKTKSIYIALSDVRKQIKETLSAEDHRLFNRRPLIEADYRGGILTKDERDLLYMEMDATMLEAVLASRAADEKVLELAVSCMELKKKIWQVLGK